MHAVYILCAAYSVVLYNCIVLPEWFGLDQLCKAIQSPTKKCVPYIFTVPFYPALIKFRAKPNLTPPQMRLILVCLKCYTNRFWSPALYIPCLLTIQNCMKFTNMWLDKYWLGGRSFRLFVVCVLACFVLFIHYRLLHYDISNSKIFLPYCKR